MSNQQPAYRAFTVIKLVKAKTTIGSRSARRSRTSLEMDTILCSKRFPSPIATDSAKSFCVLPKTTRMKPSVTVKLFAR